MDTVVKEDQINYSEFSPFDERCLHIRYKYRDDSREKEENMLYQAYLGSIKTRKSSQ